MLSTHGKIIKRHIEILFIFFQDGENLHEMSNPVFSENQISSVCTESG